MRRRVIVDVEAGPPGAVLLTPKPFGHWGQRTIGFTADGAGPPEVLGATNARQEAYALSGDGPVRLTYEVEDADAAAPDWVWQAQENRYTIADPGLRALAEELCAGQRSEAGKLRAIAEHAREMFDYDHPEDRFNDGHDAVPTLCGTTKGSCVDINTFMLAAARAQGLTGQYLMGYWFGPGRFATPDAHCWLVFRVDGAPQFWDVAHHLKWGVEGFGPGLNPAGGRRVGISCGRGLVFETANGAATISHFGEPEWVLPGGEVRRPKVQISLSEEEMA